MTPTVLASGGPSTAQVIVTKSAPGLTTYHLVGWDGKLLRTFDSRAVAGAIGQLGQSPDGSRFVAAGVGPLPQRAVVTVDGARLGILDPHDQFRWADDSRHLCVVHNPNPAAGVQSSIAITDGGKEPRELGDLGTGSGDSLHDVAVCSVTRDLVVILDEDFVEVGGDLRTVTSSIREFSLSTFHLLRKVDLSSTPATVIESADGRYFAEESLRPPFFNTIIRAADGATVASVNDRIVLGFTGDDTELVVGLQTASTATDLVEVRKVSGGSVVASLPGHMTVLQFRPASADVFLAVTTLPLGRDPLANAALEIVHGDGTTSSVQVG